jgi:3-phenylpropionate/trans-cinnamate dioxygenase ferredoxin subunit
MAVSEREDWVAVCPLDRLGPQSILCVRVQAVDLLLVRDGDRIFACERACPHEQADLSQGRVADGRLFCPRHFASFDLHDGNISAGWPSRPLRRYPVRMREGQIWIDAEAVRAAAG